MQVETRYPAGSRTVTRRVRRTLKRVDPWSVLKFSLLFYASLMLVGLFAFALLFLAASSAGVVERIEDFVQGVGWPEFQVRGAQVFRALILIGVANTIAWSAVNVFLAFLYNLVADVIGGIEVTMTEQDV